MANVPERGAINDNSLEIIENGGVVIENGKIIEVGDFSLLSKNGLDIIEIKYPCVLLPGFIDSHTHVCHYGNRSDEYAKRNSGISYQQILAEGGGIHNTMNSTSNCTDDQLRDNTLKRLKRHFLEGVLTCEVKSGYAPSLEDEIRMLKIINKIDSSNEIDLIPTCLAAHVTPKSFQSSKQYLESIINELLPKIKEENLSNRVDIFIEEKAFSVSEASHFLKNVKNDFLITAHANQFTSGGLKVGVDNEAVSVDHLEVITDDEINYLSKSNTTGVVLPGCSLGLGIPFAPARKLLDNNCKVSIAYKNLKPTEKFINKHQNPPTVEIEFFSEQKNIQNINCFSNEGSEWRNSIMKFEENVLKINFREKFTFRRGRVNCSLKDGDLWRWLGIQMSIDIN